MREILFKGKRLDNGEWVEGDLLHLPHGVVILANGYANVDPETVCQYTGLKDKNRNKIWENDVVKKVDSTPLGWHRERICKVSWDKEGCWLLTTTYGDGYLAAEFSSEQLEVVGNIFDNKELLEGD